MIKNPAQVRDRVLSDVVYMLTHVRSMLSFLPETEIDALTALQSPQRQHLEVEITNLMMGKFGHDAKPKEARFCKTRRALAKKTPKGPRGEPKVKSLPDDMEAA
jgi:hypothetical protein